MSNELQINDKEGAMSAMQSWCYWAGVCHKKLTTNEYLLFEAELFTRICEELKEIFRQKYKEFFHLMKFTVEMENEMLEVNFLRLIIDDIVSTEEYSLNGIANYTNTHEDVVQEVVLGLNLNPSATFLQRIIQLHRSVRQELYQKIIEKIISEYY
jgi:hypothetical protein